MPESSIALAAAIAFVIVGVGGVLVAAWQTTRRYRRRVRALERVALDRGFTWEPECDLAAITSFGRIPLFGRDTAREALHVMTGRIGADAVKVFLFTHGPDENRFVETVALFPAAAPALPDMEVLARGRIERLLDRAPGIDFPSNPVFSRRHLVLGRDERAIRAALDDGILALLEQRVGWSLEVSAGTVGVYRAGNPSNPEDLTRFIDEARALLAQLRKR